MVWVYATSNYTPFTCGVGTQPGVLANIPPATCPVPAQCPTNLYLNPAPYMYVSVNGTLITIDLAAGDTQTLPIVLGSQTVGFAALAQTPSTLVLYANAVTLTPLPPPSGPPGAQGALAVQLTVNGTPALVAPDGTQYAWPVPVGAAVQLKPVFTMYNCAAPATSSCNVLYTLDGEPATYTFPDASSASPPFYVDAHYRSTNGALSNRLIMHATGTFTQSLLQFTLPPWANYGYNWGVLGMPLYSSPSGSFLSMPLVPGAVFNVYNSAKLALTATAQADASVVMAFQAHDPSLPSQVFTVLQNYGNGCMLAVLDPAAPGGVWAIQTTINGPFDVKASFVSPALCTTQLGIIPAWSDAYSSPLGVALLSRTVSPPSDSSADPLNNDTILRSNGDFVVANTWCTTFNSPPSFFRAQCPVDGLDFTMYLLPAACSSAVLDTYTANACWKTSPYGCLNQTLCALASTLAGATTCACNAASPSAVTVAKQFVADACAVPYTSRTCYSVAGTRTSSCSGWSMPGLREACQSACTFITTAEGTSAFCDSTGAQFCYAHPHMGDCACLNVQTSSFPAATEGGRSFPAAQAALFNQFGLSGIVQLQPECFWPTCDAVGGAGIQYGPTYHAEHCPAVITTCETDVSRVLAQNSTVNVNIVQNCGFNTSSLLACSSTIFSQFKQYGGPLPQSSSASSSASSSRINVSTYNALASSALLAGVSIVTAALLALMIWLAVQVRLPKP